MRGLALDLGTKTGFALLEYTPGKSTRPAHSPVLTSGTWLLATDKELKAMRKAEQERCCDPRLLALLQRIEGLCPLDWIIFEDVLFCTSQAQAQLWSSFRALVMVRCGTTKIHAVPVQTLKKFATGTGAATKECMAIHLAKKHRDRYFTHREDECEYEAVNISDRRVLDDNEVDALHLLDYAVEILKLAE